MWMNKIIVYVKRSTIAEFSGGAKEKHIHPQ